MSSKWSKVVRLRMEATGENYTTALRWLQAHPEEAVRLERLLYEARLARQVMDGLNESEAAG